LVTEVDSGEDETWRRGWEWCRVSIPPAASKNCWASANAGIPICEGYSCKGLEWCCSTGPSSHPGWAAGSASSWLAHIRMSPSWRWRISCSAWLGQSYARTRHIETLQSLTNWALLRDEVAQKIQPGLLAKLRWHSGRTGALQTWYR